MRILKEFFAGFLLSTQISANPLDEFLAKQLIKVDNQATKIVFFTTDNDIVRTDELSTLYSSIVMTSNEFRSQTVPVTVDKQ